MEEYSILNTREYTLQEFRDIMNAKHPRLQPTLDEKVDLLPHDITISELVYHYQSSDENGKPIMLSALMLIPKQGGAFTAERLWLENRATQSADKNVPTHNWNIGEVHVLNNMVLVSPDLMSFGASIHKPICYCHAGLAARNSVDAVIAAQHILRDLGYVNQPLSVYNSGHSQGGFDALSVHRYMETEATEDENVFFPLEHSFCADGPYTPDIQTQIVLSREKYLYGAYMVMNAMSHLHYHSDYFEPGITIDDFLTDAAKELQIASLIEKKEVGNKELVKYVMESLGTRTSNLFVPDAYLPDGKLYDMVMRCSKADRLIDGWMPSKPIYFYHAHYDECVVVECLQAVKMVWGHLPNVMIDDDLTPIENIPNKMVHAYSGGVFHRRLLEQVPTM